MDTLKSAFEAHDPYGDLDLYAEDDAEDTGDLPPPLGIGQDERRMQVRAYNFWAGLIEDRNFPSIEDLDPASLPDFGPSSVLLDFSTGTENPGIAYLGTMLAAECGGGDAEIHMLSDVPPRSLLSRITDHYLQIIANQAPIGFEAEFVNQAGFTILYRGILLPFSSDDDTIDFIYGVINWKELADARSADELLLEIDQAIADTSAVANPLAANDALSVIDDGTSPLIRKKQALEPRQTLVEWADGPDEDTVEGESYDFPELPRPSFGLTDVDAEASRASYEMPLELSEEYDRDFDAALHSAYNDDAPSEGVQVPAEPIAEPVNEMQPDLADLLAAARQQVMDAESLDDRTRTALYCAIGQAWDFAIAASHDHQGFAELLEDAGLKMQDRAPMTPVVKLVFGANYDKTRLTEYAAALSHAQRLDIEQGRLADFLANADGGLKGVVAAERRARREEAGKPEPERRSVPRASIARKLRLVTPLSLAEIAPEGDEFGLLMIRRTPQGAVEVLGEVPRDIGMVEKAAKSFV